jgi:hypothetical protein
MNVNVDTASLNVVVNMDEQVYYNDHVLCIYHKSEQLKVRCQLCGQEEELGSVPDDRFWTAVCYLLSGFDGDCDGLGESIENEVKNTMQSYVGQAASGKTKRRIRRELRETVSGDIDVTFS